jgi:hypothetical protein
MKRLFFPIALCLVLLSCSSKSEKAGVMGYAAAADESGVVYSDSEIVLEEEIALKEDGSTTDGSLAPAPDQPVNQKAEAKKIIKTGSLSMNVVDLQQQKSTIDSLVKKFKAYYDNEQLTNSDYQTQYSLTIRVPVTRFESFVAAVEQGGGEVNFKNIDARDVTEEYIDLETRLANKRKYMERYVQLLQQAKKVDEVLAIQEKIRAIEEEVESVMGRLKYLSNQVGYSTLELTLIQKKEFHFTPGKRAGFFEKVKESVLRGWFGFIDFFYFILRMWVYLLVAAGVVYAWKKFRKRKKATN